MIHMEGNVGKKLRESIVNASETEEKVFNKPSESLFGKPKSNPINTSLVDTTEDGTLFNVLPAYKHILSKLETAKETYMKSPRLTTIINIV